MPGSSATDFDARERRIWSGYGECYRQGFAPVCAGAVPSLIDSACVRSGIRVLDVGTGTGSVAGAAAARGAEVTAVDADPSMIEVAARLVPAVVFHVAALPALPFGDGRFAAVLANFVINHVGCPLAALAELGRVTAPGGYIAVTIWPQPPSPGTGLLTRAIRDCGSGRQQNRLAPGDDFPRTETGLGELVAAAGLHDVTCRSIDWQFAVDPKGWWRIASSVSWMREFTADHPPDLLERVRSRFDQLSLEFQTPEGHLALPVTALLATGRA